MIDPQYRAFARQAVFRSLEHGEGFDLELPLRTPDQRLIFVCCICTVEKDAGRITRLCGSLQDITDHRASENQRAELQRTLLENRRVESLGTLSTGIAHDFNNLLTTILSNLSLAREELPKSSPLQHYLAEVEQSGLRAAKICQHMLAYTGHVPMKFVPVDMSELLQHLQPAIERGLGPQSRFSLKPLKEPCLILADEKFIQNMLLSMIQNAVEARREAELIVALRISLVRIDANEATQFMPRFSLNPGDFVCLALSDNGTGMDAATLQQIFEPFFSTKLAGRGLGLAAVQGIIRVHRGAIAVESQTGKGSLFRIYLPLHVANQSQS